MRIFFSKIVILVHLFIGNTKIQAEEKSLYQFCFSPETEMRQVESSIQDFLLKEEKIEISPGQKCFEIYLTQQRQQFFEIYLQKKFRLLPTARSNNFKQQLNDLKNCSLTLIEENELAAEKKEAKWDPWKDQGRLEDKELKNNETTESMMLIQEGSLGSLRINYRNVDAICDYINENRYSISLSLSGHKNLSTTISISRGEKINIGEIVKNLDEKNKDLSTQTGVNISTEEATKKTKFYLKIN